jgi:hypothetical protein
MTFLDHEETHGREPLTRDPPLPTLSLHSFIRIPDSWDSWFDQNVLVPYTIYSCLASVHGGRKLHSPEYGAFAAVFDGHGGNAISQYLRQKLYANVQATAPVTSVQECKDALCAALFNVDREVNCITPIGVFKGQRQWRCGYIQNLRRMSGLSHSCKCGR